MGIIPVISTRHLDIRDWQCKDYFVTFHQIYSGTEEKINSIVLYSICWQCHPNRHSATRELTCPGLVFLESPLHFDGVG